MREHLPRGLAGVRREFAGVCAAPEIETTFESTTAVSVAFSDGSDRTVAVSIAI